MRIITFFIFILGQIIFSGCRNEGGKTSETTDPPQPEIPVSDSLLPGSIYYSEYQGLQRMENNFDPCEILTMNTITAVCQPTTAVTIENFKKEMEKTCGYVWNERGTSNKVHFSILPYSVSETKLKELFKADALGVIQKTSYGIRWVHGHYLLTLHLKGDIANEKMLADLHAGIRLPEK